VHSTLHTLLYSTAGDRFALCRMQRCGPIFTINSGSPLSWCAPRQTLQRPKMSSARPRPRRFRLLPQVTLKAGDLAQTFDVQRILRITSDSTTTSVSSPQLPRRWSSLQVLRHPGAPQDPSGVMVVRESICRHRPRRICLRCRLRPCSNGCRSLVGSLAAPECRSCRSIGRGCCC
jgi:hypothetical protein